MIATAASDTVGLAEIDFVEGRVAQFTVDVTELGLGVPAPFDCGGTLDAFLWDSPAVAPSAVHFFLARPAGEPDYGQSTDGQDRVVTFGDCP